MLITSWILPRSELKAVHSKLVGTTPESICIPAQLRTTVPDCALECLQTFVLNNYSNHACSTTADLSFLCKTPTLSGLTIGEGSLQCVVSSCLNFNAQIQSGYTICDGMADAISNLAGTITVTISAIKSLTTSEPLVSVTPDLSSPVPPATITESLTSAISVTSGTSSGDTISIPPYIAPTSSSSSLTTNETPPFVISTSGSTTKRPSVTSTTKATQASSANSGSRIGSTTSTIQSSSTSTGTSAAVNASAEKTLSTSAIAGIATASVVVTALVLGYLAYYLMVKRKAKRNRKSQRLSEFFPPIDGNNVAGAGSTTIEEKNINNSSPERRFYAGEVEEPTRTSFGRYGAVAPSNIGVAVTQDGPTGQTRGKLRPDGNSSHQHLTLFPFQKRPPVSDTQERRWSIASSLENDVEAQTQDVLILASPKSRSSARSFSSTNIPRPPPLRLSKVNSSTQRRNSRIVLTPVYDNGYFDSTIRQIPSNSSLCSKSSDSKRHNQPPARNTLRDDSRPFWSQNRRTLQRFPIKIAADNRKKSEPSSRSVSVYTEIEEDDTPEKEEEKQFPAVAPISQPNDRTPLRDLAWPRIPRSASIAKQAEKPHSPRKIFPMQSMDSEQFLENTSMHIQEKPVLTRNPTSTTTIQTESSESPVFPLPPSRNATRLQTRADGELMRQISNAYKTASSPLATRNAMQASARCEIGRSDSRLSIRRPEQSIAPGMPWPGFPPPIPLRSPLRGRAPPFPVKNSGWNTRIGHPEF